ncbi:MAG: hypothetical protein WC657_07510 [Candidatus Paceibacterota bacterium]
MSKYQCHNREPLRDSAWVQSGWSEIGNDFGSPSRMPEMVKIPDPLSKHCQYQRDKKDDPKCNDCRWKE